MSGRRCLWRDARRQDGQSRQGGTFALAFKELSLGMWYIVILDFSVAALARCGLCGSGGEKIFQLFTQDSNLRRQ
jgi:hypothetical protein